MTPQPETFAPTGRARSRASKSVEDVADELDIDPDRGLSDDEIERRRREHGPNRIERVARDPAWRLFAQQFKSPLILLLIAAAAVAGFVGELRDAVVIATVLFINGVIGFVQEYRAQKSMAALQEMLTFMAVVRRGGETREIDGAEIVPGDIVLLEGGDRVPADGRLREGREVAVDESTLTGETTPVDKQVEPVDDDVPLAERASELFMGTTVVRGEAQMIVTRTGMDTEMGAVSAEMREAEGGQSPLEQRLGTLATKLASVALLAAAAVVGVAMLRGDSFGDALIDGVVLAVASIPEGLPAIVTVTLALGVRAIARRGAIIENLNSIHTLGATTVICTDKTGTLTVNQMTVRALRTHDHRFDVSGEGYKATVSSRPTTARRSHHARRSRSAHSATTPTSRATMSRATRPKLRCWCSLARRVCRCSPTTASRPSCAPFGGAARFTTTSSPLFGSTWRRTSVRSRRSSSHGSSAFPRRSLRCKCCG